MNNKIAGFILIFCIFSLNAAEARLSLPKSHVKVFDTVINNVDAAEKLLNNMIEVQKKHLQYLI